jgi:dimethylargininase
VVALWGRIRKSFDVIMNKPRSIAITRALPASINRCELTYHDRVPIDVARARAQHAAYQLVLARHGYEVVELPEEPKLPDSVFVEDAAVVLDECAIITRPGAESRRAEIPSIRTALARYRELHEIKEPGTLDGGDVLQLGRRLFVGLSTRTDQDGIEQLRKIVKPFDYEVVAVDVDGSLHLKSAVTEVADDLIVVDVDVIDPGVFGVRYVEVPPNAANMLRVNGVVLCPLAGATVAARLEAHGVRVELVDNSELAKAEGGLTCCSLLFDANVP